MLALWLPPCRAAREGRGWELPSRCACPAYGIWRQGQGRGLAVHLARGSIVVSRLNAMPASSDDCARSWIHLSPVSPANFRLSPVLPGTVFLNADKDLRAVFPFVPGVPGKKQSHPEGNRRAAVVAGPPWPPPVRVIQTPLERECIAFRKGGRWTVDAHPLALGPPWLPPVRVIRAALSRCSAGCYRGLSEGCSA